MTNEWELTTPEESPLLHWITQIISFHMVPDPLDGVPSDRVSEEEGAQIV